MVGNRLSFRHEKFEVAFPQFLFYHYTIHCSMRRCSSIRRESAVAVEDRGVFASRGTFGTQGILKGRLMASIVSYEE